MKIMLHQKQVYFNANHRTITTDKRTLSTVVECCEKLVNADRLPNLHCGGSIESTTTIEGSRSPYSSGIFLSQIHLSNGYQSMADTYQKTVKAMMTLTDKAEFVKWLISRDKPSIRANKASRSIAVVETISHPFKQGGNLLLTKQLRLSQMLFKFLLLGEKRLTVRIRAKSEAEARQRLNLSKSTAICIARFSDNLTACKRPPMGEVSEMAYTPMVDGHSYSTSPNGVSANSLHETSKPCTKDAMFKAEDCMKRQARLYETAQNLVQNDNLLITEQKTILHPFAKIGYSAPVVAKSTASRRKLNNLSMANDSTPLTRAFFVRSLRTPKENALSVLLSMVGRIGQRLGVGCEPLIAVSYPDTLYRQAVGSKAVDIKNLSMELSQMFYKFLFTGSRLRITVYARTLAEAYKRLPIPQANSQAVLIARLPVQGGIYA